MNHTILIVDDESVQRPALAGFLKKKKDHIEQAASGQEALNKIDNQAIDLVLSDLRMPGMEGSELLQHVKQKNPQIEVIVMTAYGSIEQATAAMKDGAADFITKPIDLEQLELQLKRVLDHKQLVTENEQLREMVRDHFEQGGIIGNSEALKNSLSIVARVAPSKATVMILGESGTGKEMIARAIHAASPRKVKPFVAVNMAALSDNLVESELFGHEKGAFTGADKVRQGRFELAHSGTLFIDEVADMPLTTQVKLLRVLQEQRIERIGSGQSREIDVRVIAATNKPLAEMVKNGEFREDLYYRLNVVTINLPPLRGRREDIPALIDHFQKRYAHLTGKTVHQISNEAMHKLMQYDYPGNIRELENIIEQATVLCRQDTITVDELPSHLMQSSHGRSLYSFQEKVKAFEINLIKQALQQADGVQTRAAELLGITERNLRYKINKYGLK